MRHTTDSRDRQAPQRPWRERHVWQALLILGFQGGERRFEAFRR